MLKLKNREAVLEALIEQIKEFQIDLNGYQTDVYLYVKDGNGTIDTFTNVGGNSWLDDDHFTIYSDKEHNETRLEALKDGESYKWVLDELNIPEQEVIDALSADLDEEEREDIHSVDDLDPYEVEAYLDNNYSDEIKKYYETYTVDNWMEGIYSSAENALDEFEDEYSYVVINDRKFCSEYSDYDEAVKAAEELGDDAKVDIWNDYDIFNAFNVKPFGE